MEWFSKQNPTEELSRICRFLGLERDVHFLQTVLEECSIGKMRDRSVAFWDQQLGIENGASIFHRKGLFYSLFGDRLLGRLIDWSFFFSSAYSTAIKEFTVSSQN